MRRYPLTAYRRISGGNKGVTLSALSPAEDGDHYSPESNFFEWWYFDVAFDDGSYLVMILHSNLFTIHADLPTVDLRYYPSEGPPTLAIAHFDREAYTARSNRCQVEIGNCVAVDEGDRYHLSLHQKPLSAELTFWPQLPGWKAGTSSLFADPSSGHYFNWVVPLPRARVEGTLTVAGQKRAVVGVGYHDHNWGNAYLADVFERWVWVRVMMGEWTIIFYDLIGRGTPSPRVTPLVLARGSEILLATDQVDVQAWEPARDSHTGVNYSRHLCLTTKVNPALELTLTPRRALEALDFAALRWPLAMHPFLRKVGDTLFYMTQGKPIVGRPAAWLLGKGAYLRWEADYHLSLPDYAVVKTGRTLYEMMVLG